MSCMRWMGIEVGTGVGTGCRYEGWVGMGSGCVVWCVAEWFDVVCDMAECGCR